MKNILWVSILVAALVPSWSLAAKSKKQVKQQMAGAIVESAPELSYEFMSGGEFETLKKQMGEVAAKNRGIAQSGDVLDENAILSEDLRDLRNRIIGGPKFSKDAVDKGTDYPGVRTADELAAVIAFAQDNYEKLQPDAKLLAIYLSALEPFRGLTVRLYPLFEKNKEFKQVPVAHAAAVTALRLTATGLNVFLPTPQWKAGFSYLTEPYVAMGEDIRTEAEFKNYVRTKVDPSVALVSRRLKALINKSKDTKIYVDTRVLNQTANFAHEKDRFFLLGQAELRLLLSNSLLLQSGIQSALAYKWEGLLKATDSLANVYGFQNWMSVDGATAEGRTKVLAKFKGKLFVAAEHNRLHMASSYLYLIESIREAKLAWSALNEKNRLNDFSNLIDPRVVVPFNRPIQSSFQTLESIIPSDDQMKQIGMAIKSQSAKDLDQFTKVALIESAAVRGETIKVDVQKFFLSQPPSDLMDFLPGVSPGTSSAVSPAAFEQGPKLFLPTEKGAEHQLARLTGKEYRNFRRGSPIAWNLNAFNPYFPDVKDSKGVQDAARILSQVWGGWLLGIPLSAVIL